MNGDVFLNIFPTGSLSASIITTVYVGVCVVVFFNLRFGWSPSGLVVPGYLVPLLIINPLSAAVVMVEGAMAYALVLILFEYASRIGGWNSVFGRDRFFALVLSSVAVRLAMDGWLLPVIGEIITLHSDVPFDYQNQLYSFGLVVVALIANHFWKPGFARGIIPFAVTLGLTWAIIRFGLMEWTNFSISNLGYMYEDIAASMLAAPKAYIILLTTAFIASHMNLQYGWEYSGILIPSLIALLWYQPMKIVASFVETFVILAAAAMIIRLPVLKKSTIEGARKILLFFTISYVYKFLLAYAMLALFPEKKISDYYGFGYLLPSLLAVKMFDKEMAANITRATIQTSFTAIIIASAAGFGLTYVSPLLVAPDAPDALSARGAATTSDQSLSTMIQVDKVRLYSAVLNQASVRPAPQDIERFSQGVQRLLAYAENKIDRDLQTAQHYLSAVGYDIFMVEERYLYLRDGSAESAENQGIYVIDLKTDNRLGIEIPAPISENGVLAAGEVLFRTMAARTLAIASSDNIVGLQDSELSVPVDPRTFFNAFHRIANRSNALQIRGYDAETLRSIYGLRLDDAAIELSAPESVLWVKKSLPPGLRLKALEQAVGQFQIRWESPPAANLQRFSSPSGFSELYLNRPDMLKVFYSPVFSVYETPMEVRDQRIEGYLQERLLTDKKGIAQKGSGAYRPPSLAELLLFDREILTPMVRLADTGYRDGDWSANGLSELRAVSGAASAMGYRLIRYRHKPTAQDYLLLNETSSGDADGARRHWGTYVLRLGDSRGYAVQIPRPIFEINAFEFGVSLFNRLDAVALLISGAHKDANPDGAADPVQMRNKQNLFNLFHQVLLRERPDTPIMAVQTRALGLMPDRPSPGTDLLIAFGSGLRNVDRMGPLARHLMSLFQSDRLQIRFVDGSPETAGYEVGGTPQARYLEQTAGDAFALVWVTPEIRASFRQQTENRVQDLQFDAVGVQTVRGYIQRQLTEGTVWETGQPAPGALRERIKTYMETRDLVVLRTIIDRWPQWRFLRFIDLDSRQAFLLVYVTSPAVEGDGRLLMTANLSPLNFTSTCRIGDGIDPEGTISRFLTNRSAWLVYGDSP